MVITALSSFPQPSSQQVTESLPHMEQEVKEDADIGEEQRDCRADGKVQELEGERKVEEEELFPHGTVTWDPPRRSGRR